jgi:hypothetical protein
MDAVDGRVALVANNFMSTSKINEDPAGETAAPAKENGTTTASER